MRHIGLHEEGSPCGLFAFGMSINVYFFHSAGIIPAFIRAINISAKAFGTILAANLTAMFGMASKLGASLTLVFLAASNTLSLVLHLGCHSESHR